MPQFSVPQLQEGLAWIQANAATLPPQFVADRTAELQAQLQAAAANPNAPMDAAAAGGAPAFSPAPAGAPPGTLAGQPAQPTGAASVGAGPATAAPQATQPTPGQPSTIDEAISRFQSGQMSFGQLLQFVTVVNTQNFVPNPQQQAAGFLQGLGIAAPGAGVASVGGANPNAPMDAAAAGGQATPAQGSRRPSPTIPGGFEAFINGQWVPISGGAAASQPPPPPPPPPPGQQSGAPTGWPAAIPFPPRRVVRIVDPVTREVTLVQSQEVDGEAIRDIMHAFGLGGFTRVPGGVDALVARELANGNFDRARQIVNASQGGTGFQPSPTTQQQLDRALQNALANGNFDEVRRLRALLAEPTGFQAAQEADRARASQQAFSFGQSQEARTAARAQLENSLATARDQREANAARSELARLDAQEARSAAAFPLTEQLRRNQDTRAAAEQAFRQGLATTQEQRATQAQAFGQAQERLQAGLNILRSPGDQFLFQTRLRGTQPNQPFQLGGTAISRNTFLEPFGQQGLSGQPQAGQAFSGLLQSEARPSPAANNAPPSPAVQAALAGFGTTGNINDLSRHIQQLPPAANNVPPVTQQSPPFGIGSGLQQAFAGQQIGRPRQLPTLGAPPFLNPQQSRNLLPSEREMRNAEIRAQGFNLGDFEEQERRQNPQAFSNSPFGFRRSAARRAF